MNGVLFREFPPNSWTAIRHSDGWALASVSKVGPVFNCVNDGTADGRQALAELIELASKEREMTAQPMPVEPTPLIFGVVTSFNILEDRQKWIDYSVALRAQLTAALARADQAIEACAQVCDALAAERYPHARAPYLACAEKIREKL